MEHELEKQATEDLQFFNPKNKYHEINKKNFRELKLVYTFIFFYCISYYLLSAIVYR